MVSIPSLWLPILLSAVGVFAASSILHMVLPFHRKDFQGIAKEDEARAALGPLNIPPGEYMMPHGEGAAAMKDPAFLEKYKQGPVILMTVMRSGVPSMGGSLIAWFLYSLAMGIVAAYLATRTLDASAHYLQVFRITGTVAFAGYALAHWQSTIWYKRKLSTTIKNNVDGLVYALITGGFFGWLWPSLV